MRGEYLLTQIGIIVSGNNACACSRSQAPRCRHWPQCRKFCRYSHAIFADMTTPRGCLRRLTAKMMRLARNGDVEGLRAYVRSDAFLVDFTGRRQSAMRCYWKVATTCEAKARRPLVQPRAIDTKRTQEVNWSDPTMRAKLAAACHGRRQ